MDSEHGHGANELGIGSYRDALVERLVEKLTGAAPRSVVLRGPAGIGKSRVAERVVDALEVGVVRGGGAAVFAGEAQQFLDFGALLHLIPLDAPPVTAEFELVQRLRRGLVEQATRTVVSIDDVGMLDRKSAAIVDGLVRTGDITVLVDGAHRRRR